MFYLPPCPPKEGSEKQDLCLFITDNSYFLRIYFANSYLIAVANLAIYL